MKERNRRSLLNWLPSLVIAVVATGMILCAVVPTTTEGERPVGSEPGITLDESFNVQQGVRLAVGIPQWLSGNLSTAQLWGEPDDLPRQAAVAGYHLPDHPPLGRLWLGVSHQFAGGSSPPDEPEKTSPPFVTAAARTGSAVALGLTVLLVGWMTARWSGPVAGAAAAIALASMPRVFGHAHIASLETVMNLAFVAAVLGVAALWGEKPPGWKASALTGFLFGLALLTKIQAVFIPVPVAVWALWRYRTRAILPLAIWGGVALATLFAGWPWLWLDPLAHLSQYFGRTTERVALKVYYFGTAYADRETPWHYPFVMFLTTIPLGWLALGKVGGWCSLRRAKDGQSSPEDVNDLWRGRLLFGAMLFPLMLFAWPGVVVYDGVRLFLPAFPLLAVFAGKGAAIAVAFLQSRWNRAVAVGLAAALVAGQFTGAVLLRPCYLSYYNGLTGGLWGAERLGLETTYWGDSITADFRREMAEAIPAGETVQVSPVLDASFLRELHLQSPAFRAKNVRFAPYDPSRFPRTRYVLCFRRRADLFPELQSLPPDAKLVGEVRRQGVWLAALYEWRQGRDAD